MHSQGPEVKDKMNVSKMIEGLRTERKQFIKEFPDAIKLVIDVALAKKLENVGKQNKLYVKNLVTKSNKLCMNSHCSGKLDQNFECLKCLTKFCKTCEKVKKNEEHICKTEDVESLKLISEIRHCPNCNIAIERSQGCNHMTCASCKTMFNYITGEISEHGSHNELLAPLRTKFKFDFKQNYPEEIGRKLYIIECHEPKEPSVLALNNIIQKILAKEEGIGGESIGEEGIDKGKIDDSVLLLFERYLKSKLEYINFINVTIEITELHTEGKLEIEDIDRIIRKNRWV